MLSILRVIFFLSSLALGLPLAGRVTHDIGPGATFDYVIVGCGVSGLVLANRLSGNPDVSVLCIEAGPLDQGEPDVLYPFNLYTEVGGQYDWNIGTVPQTQLNGNSRPTPAGHVVGGGSIINGMVWNRGQQDDFDAWESFSNPGWAWSDMLPYFIRVMLASRHRRVDANSMLSLKPTRPKPTLRRPLSQSHTIPLSMEPAVLFKSAIPTIIGVSQVC